MGRPVSSEFNLKFSAAFVLEERTHEALWASETFCKRQWKESVQGTCLKSSHAPSISSLQINWEKEVLGRTNRLFSLIRHGPHWKRRVQQFLYCCVCIRYRGNVSTEPLPSNDKGFFTEPLSSNDRGTHTHTHTHTQQHEIISLLYFSKWGK
jgi:hypothetical protein